MRYLYGHYERLEPLLENVQRDAAVMPLVGHALEFRTWQSLVRRQGCRTNEAVQLMLAFVRAAASEEAGAMKKARS